MNFLSQQSALALARLDGQIQVFNDVVGLAKNNPPKHAKQYINLYQTILNAVKKYQSDINNS